MCGLVGVFGRNAGYDSDSYEAVLRHMAESIIHRGPDDYGYWSDSAQCIWLAHRRLSIVDLSPAGHQPMVSDSGRFVIAFNGEIYNHLIIRAQIEKSGQSPNWRGHSDTETLLAGFEAFGVETTIKKTIGMFAFALWDKLEGKLILARDRLGEKPLYYGWQGGENSRVFLFGSELKALKAHPAFAAEIDRGALCLFLRHNYIPAPYTIYQGISKLEPGCLLELSLGWKAPKIFKYWDAVEVARKSVTNSFAGTGDEAVDALELLTKDAVRQQMISDVPLGAFLSGGIDSTTIVALMQEQSSQPVKTFSIGFDERGYDEALYAKAVANHLGTKHTELYVTPKETMDVIPRLPNLYCEPFADPSQIPNFIVSQLARQHVTVALSGDAGDELFCGYTRYHATDLLWQHLTSIPAPFRSFFAKGITAFSPATWDRLVNFFPGFRHHTSIGVKMERKAGLLSSRTVDELYWGTVSQIHNPSDCVIGGIEPATQLTGLRPPMDSLSAMERMMALDMVSYLPDDILVKVDRAGMGVSLESRVPFLDHRVIEFAWSLPIGFKFREGVTKWPLRQILSRYVPVELIDRPKMGFTVPICEWLRGPLHAWAEALLDETRLRQEGYFNPAPIRKKWTEHLTGQYNWEYQLWSVLMFQSWLESNR